jgi:ACR3 family arsenite transporter
MFALQGSQLIDNIAGASRVVVPLVLYFTIAFSGTALICARQRFPFEMAVTQAFTASGNNFELAIAVAISTFGVDSAQALATVIGPLIEVPVLLALVHLSVRSRPRYEKAIGANQHDRDLI